MTEKSLKDMFPTDGVDFYKGKKVTVTGATGLIGSYAVKLLKESGAYVRAIVHTRTPNEFTKLADETKCFDMGVPHDARKAVEGSDIVIGCAGITGGVNLPKIDPVSYVGPATAMVINTLQACVERTVERFGYLSSTTVYPPADYPLTEAEADIPLELYPLYRGIGISKRFLEKLCLYYHETTQLGVGIVRPAGAYGRFDNFDEATSHVVPGMIVRACRRENKFVAWGDGHDVRDFVHAQDVARGLLLATAKSPNAEVFNVASGTAITTRTLAETILDASGSNAELVFDTSKPSALRIRRVDVSKAWTVLGWKPQIALRDGMRDTVQWMESSK
jgi:GDP-L-fucose synthase